MSYVHLDNHDGVAVITLDRPERMNALGSELLEELREAYERIDADPAMRVGVLTGAGRAFCAGRDMKEASTAETDLGEAPTTRHMDLYMRSDRDTPLVSAVNGYAGGAGFYLATRAVDLVVAAESASFQIAEVPRGILHGWETGFWLNLPRVAAMELAFGFAIDGSRAHAMGLANDVVADDRLLEAALDRAEHIAQMPPAVIRANRELRQKLENAIPEEVQANGSRRFREVLDSGLAAEGDRSFLEKREARFGH